MGGQGKGTTTIQNTTQQATATPEEQELNRLEIERQKRLFEPTIALQQRGIDLTSQMLAGGQLPGYLGTIAQGVGKEGTQIGENEINQMVTKSLQDLYPQFQKQGILDSGVAADIAARSALATRADVAQFNAQQEYSRQAYNQGNLLNLLNLGLGGQAQVQQPILASANDLSQRLSGLRSITDSGTSNTRGYSWAEQQGAAQGWVSYLRPKNI